MSSVKSKYQMSTWTQNKALTGKDKALKMTPNKTLRVSKWKEGRNLDSRLRITLKLQVGEKSSEQKWTHCGCSACLLTSLRVVTGFYGSPYWLPKCWPKADGLPVIAPAQMGSLRIAKNCNSRSATMACHLLAPAQPGKSSFKWRVGMEWQGELGGF